MSMIGERGWTSSTGSKVGERGRMETSGDLIRLSRGSGAEKEYSAHNLKTARSHALRVAWDQTTDLISDSLSAFQRAEREGGCSQSQQREQLVDRIRDERGQAAASAREKSTPPADAQRGAPCSFAPREDSAWCTMRLPPSLPQARSAPAPRQRVVQRAQLLALDHDEIRGARRRH
eukprot:6204504-Pleurochrysis_carterae.AAC.3